MGGMAGKGKHAGGYGGFGGGFGAGGYGAAAGGYGAAAGGFGAGGYGAAAAHDPWGMSEMWEMFCSMKGVPKGAAAGFYSGMSRPGPYGSTPAGKGKSLGAKGCAGGQLRSGFLH